MAATIKNLYEVSGRPLLRERVASRSKFEDLGPDDLVVLDKKEKGFLRSTKVVLFYHTFTGMNHTVGTFPAYYSDLLKRQEHGSRLLGLTKYQIVQGRIFIWNSLKKRDFSGQCSD